MSEYSITLEELQQQAEEQAQQLPNNPTDEIGNIEVAGVIYKDSDGFLRLDEATRHAKADEVIAAFLADNPRLIEQILFWYDSFKDDPGNNAWEAMHGH